MSDQFMRPCTVPRKSDDHNSVRVAGGKLLKRSRIAATVACSSVSNIVSPPRVSVKSACSAVASRFAQLSQLISGESYRSIPMKRPLNAIGPLSPHYFDNNLLNHKFSDPMRIDPSSSLQPPQIFSARYFFDGTPIGSDHVTQFFGTVGRGSPASLFLTSPARKSANGAISSPTLAFSRASI